MKYTIGLTGGIASGKSTVSKILHGFGATIIDADKIGHEIIAKNKPAYREIVSDFGEEFLDENQNIDRKKLGAYVFKNKEALERLNEITHTHIFKEMIQKINSTNGLIVVDCALLIETGFYKNVDETWLVVADINTRVKRLMSRNGYTEEEAMARIESQMKDEEKKAFADEIIQNSGSVESLRKTVNLLFEERKGKFLIEEKS